MSSKTSSNWTAVLVCGLLVCGTTLGLAGTDLVLPAVPGLSDVLGGTPAQAQLVLAAYVAGTGIGIVGFGELGARVDKRVLLIVSLVAFSITSAAGAFVSQLDTLIWLRLAQGATGAAAAVFAPGMIRALFDERGAVRALGLLGSIESLVPALAPIAGVWLLYQFGWSGAFISVAVLAMIVAILVLAMRRKLPVPSSPRFPGGYLRLLMDPTYLRYSLNYAFTLGALLIFVFGAPAVITRGLDGTLTDFIRMQVCGIATFIVAANITGQLSERYGVERMIWLGTGMSLFGALSILVYALIGGVDPVVLAALFVPMNLGLGFCGPLSFFQAVLASRGDDTRGAAIILLCVLMTAALGTAVVAPFIAAGLAPLAAATAGVTVAAFLVLVILPERQKDSAG